MDNSDLSGLLSTALSTDFQAKKLVSGSPGTGLAVFALRASQSPVMPSGSGMLTTS